MQTEQYLKSITKFAIAHMKRSTDRVLMEPMPEVHGGRSVLVLVKIVQTLSHRLGYLGEVVEVAVVEGGEDVVELVVRRLPGVQPLLLSDCVQNVTVCKENFSWKS